MKNIAVYLKQLSLITMIAGVIAGIVLIAKPVESVQFICIIFGTVIIFLGAGSLLLYFTKLKFTFIAVLGVLMMIAGAVVCVKYQQLISAVIFLFGLFVTISGTVDFFSALDAKKNNLKTWIFSLVMSIGVIIMGVIVLINPFDSAVLLTRLLGVSLLVYAMLDLITFIQVNKISKLKTINIKDVDEININSDDIE